MFFSKTTVAIATKLLVDINYNPKFVMYSFYEYTKEGIASTSGEKFETFSL